MTETIRALVFKDGDKYVAQCLEHDVATQADDLDSLFARLDRTIIAELAMRRDMGETGLAKIPPAPPYYHSVWDDRTFNLGRISVSAQPIEFRLARSAHGLARAA